MAEVADLFRNPCIFCSHFDHVSENCLKYSTFKTRFSKLQNMKRKNCLCEIPRRTLVWSTFMGITVMCKCICEVCFQHHHIAMCPKRDPEYPSNPISMPKEQQPICLFSHPSSFSRRFLELCNFLEIFKLQQTCKYFKNLQSEPFKLLPAFSDWQYATNLHTKNAIYNRSADLIQQRNCNFMINKRILINCSQLSLKNFTLSKKDLQILGKSHPFFVSFKSCKMDSMISFQDILDAFPYATKFDISNMDIPEDWFCNFLNAKRKVELIYVYIKIKHCNFYDKNFMALYKENKNLALNITVTDQLSNNCIQNFDNSYFIQIGGVKDYDLCIFFQKECKTFYFKIKNK